MAYAVLINNLGRDGALKFLETLINVQIPSRIFSHAISAENKRLAKKEREKTFSLEMNIKSRVNKRLRKLKEENYRKQIEKERPNVLYGEQLNLLQNEDEVKLIVHQIPTMKGKRLNFFLNQFETMDSVKSWKSCKVDVRRDMLKGILEGGQQYVQFKYPQLFKK